MATCVALSLILSLNMEGQPSEQPIQLVVVDSQGNYSLTPEARQFLQDVPKPIAVVAVAGLYRTGKSYLLNRILLNRNSGFGVGPTINPCTKGLWCWNQSVPATTRDGQPLNLLIIDSEGIGALDEDQNHDLKIFTLAILSSSTFIYNSVGSIDENALQNLSLVVNLTKNVQLSAQNSEEDDPDELASYFPAFFWVVRDFALQLISAEGDPMSSKDYLERALTPQKGFSDDVEEKNRIRRLLTAYFRDRDCATLVRPLVDEQKLQQLNSCSFEELRPEFVEQAMSLRSKVLERARPKTFRGEQLDGGMYLSMLEAYLKAINEGAVPNIQNAWTYMCMEKCGQLLQWCINQFKQSIKEIKLPLSESQLKFRITEISKFVVDEFNRQQIGQQGKEYLAQLNKNMQQHVQQIALENEREALSVLKSHLIKRFSLIEQQMRRGEFAHYPDYIKKLTVFHSQLLENGPDLPKREIVYLDFLRKASTQGAEIFIKQANSKVEKAQSIGQQKQKKVNSLEQRIEKMKDELKTQRTKQRQKQEEFEQSLLHEKEQSHHEIIKLRTEAQDLASEYEKKLEEAHSAIMDLREGREELESSRLIQRKEDEKERALLELTVSQLKEELSSMKNKFKIQEQYIASLTTETSQKLTHCNQAHQKQVSDLHSELEALKEKYSETIQLRQDLAIRLETAEKRVSTVSRKYQEELRNQIEKFELYKLQSESQHLVRIQMLEEENKSLKEDKETLQSSKQTQTQRYSQNEDNLRQQLHERESETELLKQRLQFMNQSIEENKKSHQEGLERWEHKLQIQQENFKVEMEHKISQTVQEKDLESMEIQRTFRKQIEDIQFRSQQVKEQSEFAHANATQILSNKISELEQQLNQKNVIIEQFEEKWEQKLAEVSDNESTWKQKSKARESELKERISQLELQLENMDEQLSEERAEMSRNSQQSIVDLRLHYEQEKAKLDEKLKSERIKWESEMRAAEEEHAQLLDEQRHQADEQYEELKEEYHNEVTMLKDIVEKLQNEQELQEKATKDVSQLLQQQKKSREEQEKQFSQRQSKITEQAAAERVRLTSQLQQLEHQHASLEKSHITQTHQIEAKEQEYKNLSENYERVKAEVKQLRANTEGQLTERRERVSQLERQLMNQQLERKKEVAVLQQDNDYYKKRVEDHEEYFREHMRTVEQAGKKLKEEHLLEIEEIEARKNEKISDLEEKFHQAKTAMREQEQKNQQALSSLESQLSREQEKTTLLQNKCSELENSQPKVRESVLTELAQARKKLSKVNKNYEEETGRLRRQLAISEQQRQQMTNQYEKQRVLMQNKIMYQEQHKENLEREAGQQKRKMEEALSSLQACRSKDKQYYEIIKRDSISNIEKKHAAVMEEMENAYKKEINERAMGQRQMQMEIRRLTDEVNVERKIKNDMLKSNERKLRDLEEREERVNRQLDNCKAMKETEIAEQMLKLQKQNEKIRSKLQQREQKVKELEKIKQEQMLDAQRQRSVFYMEKDNMKDKQEKLAETVSRQQRDIDRLARDNEKLKAERRQRSGVSRTSFERSKFGRQDSLRKGFEFGKKQESKVMDESMVSSISVSLCRENKEPLDEINLFGNNQ